VRGTENLSWKEKEKWGERGNNALGTLKRSATRQASDS